MRGDLLARHREEAERVVAAEVVLRREREAPDVVERAEVVGRHPRAPRAPRGRTARGWCGRRSPGAGCSLERGEARRAGAPRRDRGGGSRTRGRAPRAAISRVRSSASPREKSSADGTSRTPAAGRGAPPASGSSTRKRSVAWWPRSRWRTGTCTRCRARPSRTPRARRRGRPGGPARRPRARRSRSRRTPAASSTSSRARQSFTMRRRIPNCWVSASDMVRMSIPASPSTFAGIRSWPGRFSRNSES